VSAVLESGRVEAWLRALHMREVHRARKLCRTRQTAKPLPVRHAAKREVAWGQVADAVSRVLRVHDPQIVLRTLAGLGLGESKCVSEGSCPLGGAAREMAGRIGPRLAAKQG
jgi:hypothetical protein